MNNKLPAGHITVAMTEEHAAEYVKHVFGTEQYNEGDILWILSNGGLQSAENLVTLGYLLGKLAK